MIGKKAGAIILTLIVVIAAITVFLWLKIYSMPARNCENSTELISGFQQQYNLSEESISAVFSKIIDGLEDEKIRGAIGTLYNQKIIETGINRIIIGTNITLKSERKVKYFELIPDCAFKNLNPTPQARIIKDNLVLFELEGETSYSVKTVLDKECIAQFAGLGFEQGIISEADRNFRISKKKELNSKIKDETISAWKEGKIHKKDIIAMIKEIPEINTLASSSGLRDSDIKTAVPDSIKDAIIKAAYISIDENMDDFSINLDDYDECYNDEDCDKYPEELCISKKCSSEKGTCSGDTPSGGILAGPSIFRPGYNITVWTYEPSSTGSEACRWKCKSGFVRDMTVGSRCKPGEAAVKVSAGNIRKNEGANPGCIAGKDWYLYDLTITEEGGSAGASIGSRKTCYYHNEAFESCDAVKSMAVSVEAGSSASANDLWFCVSAGGGYRITETVYSDSKGLDAVDSYDFVAE